MPVTSPPLGQPCASDHYSKSVDADIWWQAHFGDAAEAVLEFLGGDGIALAGKRVCDIGCGDGIIDFGLTVKGRPEQLVGFDLQAVDVDRLARLAEQHAGLTDLPDQLFFATSQETAIPAAEDSFDVAVSWSAFEHISDATAVLTEVRRVLTDQGVLFIQVWPFYSSAHGSHLVDWFPEGFAQYRFSEEEVIRRVRSTGDQEMAAEMLPIYQTLNRITVDELHEALRSAGFKTVKVALTAETVHLGDEVSHLPLSQSVISGIQLLAVPDLRPVEPEIAPEPDPQPPEQPTQHQAPVPQAQSRPGRVAGAVRTARRGIWQLDEVLARFD
ncbi:MAG: class I SAM-dependent methyltransferase [bacterium]